jgi:hypothetical protein
VAEASRRTFLKTGAVGAAALGAAAVVSTPTLGHAAVPSGPAHEGPFVAWVKDAKAGEISVMVGEQVVVHKDVQLAKQLAQIAARAPRL